MNPSTPSLWDLIENLTAATLPHFFDRLRTRPEPHAIINEAAYLTEAAKTLNRTPWNVFIDYQSDHPTLPDLAEYIWRQTFPDLWRSRRKPEPQTGIVLQFPMDRVRGKSIWAEMTAFETAKKEKS
jgi:hypothetical protein